MKVLTRTREYTIYKKRNQRYAVLDRNKQWVRGDEKAAILLAHNLVPIEPQLLKGPDLPESSPGHAAAEAASTEIADERPAGQDSEEGSS